MSLENSVGVDILTVSQNLAPLSKFQQAQIMGFMQKFQELGFPTVADDVRVLSTHIDQYRELYSRIESGKKEAKDKLKKDLTELPVQDFDVYLNLITKVERYLRKNYDREEVVQSAVLLQSPFNLCIDLLRKQGFNQFGIAGSYGARLPRPDSDVDLAVYGEFPIDKEDYNPTKQQIKTSLGEDLTRRIDIWLTPRQFLISLSKLQVVYFSEGINLIDLIPKEE